MHAAAPVPDQQIDLREYLAILRSRKWTILLVTALVVGSAIFFSLRQTPIYRAESRTLVKGLPSDTSGFVPPPNLATEAELVASLPVASLVQKELEIATSPEALLQDLEVEPVGEASTVLAVSYSSPDPELAQAAANAFPQSYIEFRREQASKALNAGYDAIQRRIDDLTTELSDLAAEIDRARGSGDDDLANTLEAQRSVAIARLGVLQQRLDDVQPDRAINLGGGEVIEPAALPLEPASPDLTKNGLLALFLGLALGVGLAFLRERLDDRIRGRSDLERVLDVPVVATVPKFPSSSKKRSEIITLSQPKGAASEAYRGLRTNLQFLSIQRELKSILVTSPAAAEGKTITCVNLAVAFAQSGRRVVLISADLRKPTLESYFQLDNREGLTTWLLAEDRELWGLIRDPGIDNLRVIPSGPIPPNPAELLTSPRLTEVIDLLENNADIVLVDSPPTLAVADASILATHVDGAILIVDAHKTHRSAAVRAAEELQRVGASLLGTVLNAFDPSAAPYYYQPYYYSTYASDPVPIVAPPAESAPRRSSRFSLRR